MTRTSAAERRAAEDAVRVQDAADALLGAYIPSKTRQAAGT